MPVEAAVENRMQRARALRVGSACENVVELVRIFARQVAERHLRELRCERFVERDGFLLVHANLAEHRSVELNRDFIDKCSIKCPGRVIT